MKKEYCPTFTAAGRDIAAEAVLCVRVVIAEGQALDVSVLRHWFFWFPTTSGILLLGWHGRWRFIVSLFMTQLILCALCLRSGRCQRYPEIAKTQAIFWSLFMALECLRDPFIHVFDSISLEFPLPTSAWLGFHGAVIGTPFLYVPIISAVLAAPHLWINSEKNRRRVLTTQYALAWLMVPFALLAMSLPLLVVGTLIVR